MVLVSHFMRKLLAVLALVGCTSAPPLPPTIPEERRVELEPLPPDPEDEVLPANVPTVEWVEPLEVNACFDPSTGKAVNKPCPAKNGIAMSEAKAIKLGFYKIRYREMRTNYASDRKVFGAQRELYETRLKLADKAIQDLQPSWLDKHKAELGIFGGFILGVGTVIAAQTLGD